MASLRPTHRPPPNVRNAARRTPSKSAASARPHARRSGAANPAWSRSTASNATRLFAAELARFLAERRQHVAFEIHLADRSHRFADHQRKRGLSAIRDGGAIECHELSQIGDAELFRISPTG